MGQSHGLIFMLQSLILMHFALSHAPQDCIYLILLFYGAMAILASFMACTDLHNTLSLFGHRTNTFLSFLFGSRASVIMRRQLRITSVDLTSLLRFVMKSISFLVSSLIFTSLVKCSCPQSFLVWFSLDLPYQIPTIICALVRIQINQLGFV